MARRGLNILGLVLAGAALLVLLLGAGLWVLSRNQDFRAWLVAQIQAQVLEATGAKLEMASLEGSLIFDATAQGLKLTRQGKTLLAVERLELSYNPLAMLGGRVRINSLKALRPQVNLPWDLPAGQTGGAFPALTLNKLSLSQASLRVADKSLGPLRQVDELDLEGRLSLDARGLRTRVRLARAMVGLHNLEAPVAVRLNAHLDKRRLRLEMLELTQGSNRVELAGEMQLKEPYRLQARLRAPHLEAQALPFAWPLPAPPRGPLALEITASGPWQRLRVQGALKQGEQALSLQGWLTPDTGALDLNGRLHKISLPAWGAPWLVAAEGEWRLSSAVWPGLGPLTLDLDLSKASYERISAGPVKLVASLDGRKVEVKELALQAPWGRLAGQGRLELPDKEHALSLSGSLAFQSLRPPPGLAGRLPPWLAQSVLTGKASVQGAWSTLAWELDLEGGRAAQGLEVTTLHAAGQREKQEWRIKELKLEAPLAQLEGRGRVGAEGLSLGFKLDVPDLAGLGQALSRAKIAPPIVLSGSLEARGRIKGPWQEPALRARLNLTHLLTRNVLAREVQVETDLKKLGDRPEGWATLAAAGVVSGEIFLQQMAARLEFSQGAGSLVVQAKGPETGLALRLDSQDLLSLPLKARLSKGWIQRGALGRWEQQGVAQVLLGAERVRAQGLVLAQGKERLSLEGDVQPVSGEVNARAELSEIRLNHVLGPNTNLPPAARLSGTAKVEGLLNQPRIFLQGRVRALEWPGMAPLLVEFRGNYENESMRIAGRAYYDKREVMELEGQAGLTVSLRPPVWEPTTKGIRLTATAHDLPLALAAPLLPGLQRVRGRAQLELRVDGTLARPNLHGHLSMRDGRFIVGASGQIVKGLDLEVKLEGRRVIIQRASAQSEGQLAISGQLTLPLGTPGALDLRLTSQKLLVVLGTLGQMRATSEVRLQGDFNKPVLEGRVEVSDIVVSYGLAEPAGMSDVVVLKQGQKPPPLEKKAKRFTLPPALDGLKVDLTAALSGSTRVALDDGWLEADGGLHLTKQPGGPLIFNGAVIIKRGLIIIAGKRFEVLQGKADFGGKEQPDPNLSGEARLQMGDTTVFVNVAGTAQDPSLNLSSLPPMSQADILSSIIFGRPAAELNQGQSKELSAQALALLGQVGQREMSRIFGPDLSPDVVTVHNTLSAGPSLEAGKYLSEDLYLRYRQNLGPYGGQNVGLEYRLNRYFSVESTVGTTRDNGMDLIFSRDFNLFSDDKTKPPAKAAPNEPTPAQPAPKQPSPANPDQD